MSALALVHAEADRFSPEAVERVMAFDPVAVIRGGLIEAAKASPEERVRVRRSVRHSRLDAARYLLRRGTRADRALAGRWLLTRKGTA